jgi:hypothetical protein
MKSIQKATTTCYAIITSLATFCAIHISQLEWSTEKLFTYSSVIVFAEAFTLCIQAICLHLEKK